MQKVLCILTAQAPYKQGRIQDFGLGGALVGSLGGRKSPVGSRGRPPVGVWGYTPEARRMLRHEAKKHLRREKNKSIQTDIVWQYHNYHHLIHSSFSVSSILGLKYKTPTTSVCGATSAVQSAVFWHAGHRIRWRNNTGLINKASLLKGTLP